MAPAADGGMERWSSDDPCANVDDLARSMPEGLWMNLLAADLGLSLAFQIDVLGCAPVYRDRAFAIMRFAGSHWMVHADATYEGHPVAERLRGTAPRGTGCEVRLHGCDPDAAEARARAFGMEVMQPARDKPHGLREAFLVDPDGYVWVPSVLKAGPAART